MSWQERRSAPEISERADLISSCISPDSIQYAFPFSPKGSFTRPCNIIELYRTKAKSFISSSSIPTSTSRRYPPSQHLEHNATSSTFISSYRQSVRRWSCIKPMRQSNSISREKKHEGAHLSQSSRAIDRARRASWEAIDKIVPKDPFLIFARQIENRWGFRTRASGKKRNTWTDLLLSPGLFVQYYLYLPLLFPFLSLHFHQYH